MSLSLKTPCQIIDLDQLKKNLEIAKKIKDETGSQILLALKGFSSKPIFSYMTTVLDGVSASGLNEARLGFEEFKKQVHTFSPSFVEKDFEAIAQYSTHINFNSCNQFSKFHNIARKYGCECGLRINPEYSEVETAAINPCRKYSRLGVTQQELQAQIKYILPYLDGIHMHTMCELLSDSLERTISAVENKFLPLLNRCYWFNIGGGQLFTDYDYDIKHACRCINYLKNKYQLKIILEPCEGLLLNTGYLATTVIDIIHNEIDIAILDSSAVCHLPNTLSAPYQCDILNAATTNKYKYMYQLAGNTCYAGDIWGNYYFPTPLHVGDILYFCDTAQYSYVKSSMFNGISFPDLCTFSKQDGLKILKTYDYKTFLEVI